MGGARAAHSLQPFLGELGCLPVSAKILVPRAHEAFGEDGVPLGDEIAHDQWTKYATRCWSQLEWWGGAAKDMRANKGLPPGSPALVKEPSQRDAPK